MAVIYTKKNEEILVDDEDLDWLNEFSWYLDKGYAKTTIKHNGKYKAQKMHRLIMNVSDRWVFIDHIDGNPANNRRSNLRLCTNAENSRNRAINKNNTIGIKGLYYHKQSNQWRTVIILQGKRHTKSFSCNIYTDAKELAIEWLKENRPILHGEFSRD